MMKEYCLISFININNIPYINSYLDVFSKIECLCKVVYWDRYGTDIPYQNNNIKFIPYSLKSTADTNKIIKLVQYMSVTRYIRQILKKNKFNGVILLQTQVAAACADILAQYYHNRYIIDIRDYSFENYKSYYQRECLAIKNSYAAVISSPAYKEFLPKYNYILAHNYTPVPVQNLIDIIQVQNVKRKTKNKKIIISFVGSVRFFDMDKRFINLMANDNRFMLEYIGTGSSVLEKYCMKHSIYNVKTKDRFEQRQTFLYYKNTDFINNLYGYNTPLLDYALSNKLYHAAQLGIPILVCKGTCMAEVVTKFKIGFVFDFEDSNNKKKLIDYYHKVSYEKIRKDASIFLEQVKLDNILFKKTIENFILQTGCLI